MEQDYTTDYSGQPRSTEESNTDPITYVQPKSVSFFIDIETSGLNPENNYITQIGALAVYDTGGTHRFTVDLPNMKYTPYRDSLNNCHTDLMAFLINGNKLSIEEDADPRRELLFTFLNWMLSIIGEGENRLSYKTYFYNSLFDVPFLVNFAREYGVDIKDFISGKHGAIDVLSIAHFAKEIGLLPSNIKSLSLVNVYQTLFGKKHLAHSALQDAIATYEVYKRLTKDKNSEVTIWLN